MKYLPLIITVFFAFSCSSTPQPKVFYVNPASPRNEAGSTEMYFERFFSRSSLRKIPVNVYYYPGEDAVCLQFRYQSINCNQFWDKAGRDAFVAALKRYLEEFEQKKLGKRSKKTRNAYGTVPGFFVWKKTPISVQAHSNPKYNIGYQLRDQAVFFTITQPEAAFEDETSKSRGQTSPVLVIYYTREQAEKLAGLFSQENLQGLLKPPSGTDDGLDE